MDYCFKKFHVILFVIARLSCRYVFSFCDVVKTVPTTVAGNGTQCYRTSEEEPVHYPAYQVAQTYDLCLALGKDAAPENVRWSLIGILLDFLL